MIAPNKTALLLLTVIIIKIIKTIQIVKSHKVHASIGSITVRGQTDSKMDFCLTSLTNTRQIKVTAPLRGWTVK